ncbi:hypothetical protein [Polaromonas sp. CG9_12]|nr:hypothetical protein [Polaromonas sp. CG9_12]
MFAVLDVVKCQPKTGERPAGFLHRKVSVPLLCPRKLSINAGLNLFESCKDQQKPSQEKSPMQTELHGAVKASAG